MRIEDYGLIGDCRSAALVGSNGSVDWLCWPRFDSAACFSAILGNADNGRWGIRPIDPNAKSTRAYRGDTMVLETHFTTPQGIVAVVDFMPVRTDAPAVIRIVKGKTGTVRMRMDLTLRFDYGSSVPWVTRLGPGNALVAIAGPNLAVLRSDVALKGEGLSTIAVFDVAEGEQVGFVLSYGASHLAPPEAILPAVALQKTEAFWNDWAGRCTYNGPQRDAAMRSLLTLKALIFAETGGIVAAPTTSLPEQVGGPRNWDYRYCWIRDATLTLVALMGAGYYEEAKAWRDWLHRSLAGTPDDLQIMYGLAGERRLDECEVPWLSGYQGSKPVRIGNAASGQLQLDVWGEMMDALHVARAGGLTRLASGWSLQRKALEHLEAIWRDPDDGIWEVRGGRQNFTHSKVMAWVAFDRSIKDAEAYGLEGPIDRWRAVREEIHWTICQQGYSHEKKSFTQSFGSDELDASLLLIPQVGFLPIDDPRVESTIAAIERELIVDGYVLRYRTEHVADGLPPGEGVFLACTFWLADVYQRQGRVREAETLLKRLVGLSNDLGLLSEEYDTKLRRQVGNFPQAFSHLSLVQSALSIHHGQPLRDRVIRK